MKSFALLLLLFLFVAATASPLPGTTARMTYSLMQAEYAELQRRMRVEGSSFSMSAFIDWLKASRAGTASQSSPSPQAQPSQQNQPPQAPPSGMVAEILAVHNNERALVNVPELTWSTELAASSQLWADAMVRNKLWKHSKLPGVGENLWRGLGRQFTYTEMVTGWANEKKDFVNGVFPNVKPKGGVVGHYTQMVWRDTSQVGCATAGRYQDTSFGMVLVCQYKKQGNIIGQQVY